MNKKTTDFGFEKVPVDQKAKKVAEVFDSVASRYDIMNDLMSVGLHRLWKAHAVRVASVRPGMKVLDIAGGTGDLSKAFLEKIGSHGELWLTDINESMLRVGRDQMIDRGYLPKIAVCDAEKLPFPDHFFDVVTVAFGLRNMTHKENALMEMRRVVKPGGKVLVLEFSKVHALFSPIYDWYCFKVLPKIGQVVVNDSASYQYLAESIRMHPDQDTLKAMMLECGFDQVGYTNLTGGVVALHQGTKLI